MREIDGKQYLTQDEAARRLRVSSRTLSTYIRNKVVTAPAEVTQGLRSFYAFTDKWVERAKAEIERYRQQRRV